MSEVGAGEGRQSFLDMVDLRNKTMGRGELSQINSKGTLTVPRLLSKVPRLLSKVMGLRLHSKIMGRNHLSKAMGLDHHNRITALERLSRITTRAHRRKTTAHQIQNNQPRIQPLCPQQLRILHFEEGGDVDVALHPSLRRSRAQCNQDKISPCQSKKQGNQDKISPCQSKKQGNKHPELL